MKSSIPNSSIYVAVRKRPCLPREEGKPQVVEIIGGKQVKLLDPEEVSRQQDQSVSINKQRLKETTFTFDAAFDEDVSNQQIFHEIGETHLNDVLNGINTTLFAYGATGAGKTYTMVGQKERHGLMELMVYELFEKFHQKKLTHDISVKLAYMEIYNEALKDLLQSDSKNLELREDPKSDLTLVYVVQGVGERKVLCKLRERQSGLTEVDVTDPTQVTGFLRIGNKNRSKDSTVSNEASSRSHAILQIVVQCSDRAEGLEKEVMISKLSLVDLAGSERSWANKSKTNKLEGAKINQSLLTLGNCIQALSELSDKPASKNNFIPYRGSKLTRLLKDSLGGNCKTVMIANISGSSLSIEDTYNTLQYASRAKSIKVHVQRNVVSQINHISDYSQIIEKLNRENENLRNILQVDGMINKKNSEHNQNQSLHFIQIDNQDNAEAKEIVQELEGQIKKHFDDESSCLKVMEDQENKLERISLMNLQLEGQIKQGNLSIEMRKNYTQQMQINSQGAESAKSTLNEAQSRYQKLVEQRKTLIPFNQFENHNRSNSMNSVQLNNQGVTYKNTYINQKNVQYLRNIYTIYELSINSIFHSLKFRKNEATSSNKQKELEQLWEQVVLRDEILLSQNSVLKQNKIPKAKDNSAKQQLQKIKDSAVILETISSVFSPEGTPGYSLQNILSNLNNNNNTNNNSLNKIGPKISARYAQQSKPYFQSAKKNQSTPEISIKGKNNNSNFSQGIYNNMNNQSLSIQNSNNNNSSSQNSNNKTILDYNSYSVHMNNRNSDIINNKQINSGISNSHRDKSSSQHSGRNKQSISSSHLSPDNLKYKALYPFLSAKKQRILNMMPHSINQADVLSDSTLSSRNYQKNNNNNQSTNINLNISNLNGNYMNSTTSSISSTIFDSNATQHKPNFKNIYNDYKYVLETSIKPMKKKESGSQFGNRHFFGKIVPSTKHLQNPNQSSHSIRTGSALSSNSRDNSIIINAPSTYSVPISQRKLQNYNRGQGMSFDIHSSPYVQTFKSPADSRKNKLHQLNLNLDNLKNLYTQQYLGNG